VHAVPHAGMVRLPDVPAGERIALMAQVLERHHEALETRAIITVRRGGSASHGRPHKGGRSISGRNEMDPPLCGSTSMSHNECKIRAPM